MRLGIVAAGAILAVYVANLPFYSGAGVGPNYAWRMEHGRLRVQRSAVGSRESFYIALNSEGLRFAPEWQFWSARDWMVNVPLWIPFVCAAGCAVWGWRGRRGDLARAAAAQQRCPACNYDLRGLAADACPECGRRGAGA